METSVWWCHIVEVVLQINRQIDRLFDISVRYTFLVYLSPFTNVLMIFSVVKTDQEWKLVIGDMS